MCDQFAQVIRECTDIARRRAVGYANGGAHGYAITFLTVLTQNKAKKCGRVRRINESPTHIGSQVDGRECTIIEVAYQGLMRSSKWYGFMVTTFARGLLTVFFTNKISYGKKVSFKNYGCGKSF